MADRDSPARGNGTTTCRICTELEQDERRHGPQPRDGRLDPAPACHGGMGCQGGTSAGAPDRRYRRQGQGRLKDRVRPHRRDTARYARRHAARAGARRARGQGHRGRRQDAGRGPAVLLEEVATHGRAAEAPRPPQNRFVELLADIGACDSRRRRGHRRHERLSRGSSSPSSAACSSAGRGCACRRSSPRSSDRPFAACRSSR